jgi:hypothetical protein
MAHSKLKREKNICGFEVKRGRINKPTRKGY